MEHPNGTHRPGVLEYHWPTKPIRPDDHIDHGFVWVEATESDAASKTTAYLQAAGYDTTFHPTASPGALAAVRDDVREEDIGRRPHSPREVPIEDFVHGSPEKKEVSAVRAPLATAQVSGHTAGGGQCGCRQFLNGHSGRQGQRGFGQQRQRQITRRSRDGK